MPNYYRSGLGAVGSYQVSGVPYLTGAVIAGGVEHKIEFPTVAKSVLVINKDTDTSNSALRVHFNATTAGPVIECLHYFPLDAQKDNITFNVKCKEIYISNGNGSGESRYFVAAELTGIQASEMFTLTGSGLTNNY